MSRDARGVYFDTSAAARDGFLSSLVYPSAYHDSPHRQACASEWNAAGEPENGRARMACPQWSTRRATVQYWIKSLSYRVRQGRFSSDLKTFKLPFVCIWQGHLPVRKLKLAEHRHLGGGDFQYGFLGKCIHCRWPSLDAMRRLLLRF